LVYAAACRYPLIADPAGFIMNQVPARLNSSGPEYQEPTQHTLISIYSYVSVEENEGYIYRERSGFQQIQVPQACQLKHEARTID
jgi:hypothetical protein